MSERSVDRSRSLRHRLYALSFVDEFGPLYALYTLWFNDNGISTGQVSTVFVLWAAVAIVLELPSGALADRLDRRRLLAGAFVLRAAGIALWLLWPTYAGVIIGAVLWAVHEALASGAWEAMIHDELEAIGEENSYTTVMARVGQFSNLGIATAAVIAYVSLEVGASIESLGWVTVTIHGFAIALVLGLPDVRWVAHGDREQTPWSYRAWWRTLQDGIGQARAEPAIRRLVIVGALLSGLFIVDEYVPLLARVRGGDDSTAPILVTIVWVGLLVGGELAARRPRLGGRTLGTLLIVGSIAMGVGVAGDSVWALALVGVGYVALEATWVVSDARLQERAPRETRATVTSVRGFGSGIVSTISFAITGALAVDDDPSRGVLIGIGALILTGILVARWLPNAVGSGSASTGAAD